MTDIKVCMYLLHNLNKKLAARNYMILKYLHVSSIGHLLNYTGWSKISVPYFSYTIITFFQ